MHIIEQVKAKKAALMKKIDHDLHFEGITKTPFQKELDQMVIDGKITPSESFQLFLQYKNIKTNE